MTIGKYFKQKKENFFIHIFLNFLFLFILTNPFILCHIEIPFKFSKSNKRNYRTSTKIKNLVQTIPEEEVIWGYSFFVNEEDYFLASIKIGHPEQELIALLDTSSILTLVSSKYYNPKDSKSFKITNEKYQINSSINITENYFYDYIGFFEDDKDYKMKIGLTNEDPEFFHAIIGLGRNNLDKETSFIDIMYDANIIETKSFSFEFLNSTDDSEGIFFLGIDKDNIDQETTSCNLIDDERFNSYWACEMSGFSLEVNNRHLKTIFKNVAVFSTGTNFIIFPQEYLDNKLKDYINNIGCEVYGDKEDNVNMIIRCPDSIIPQIEFTIGDNKYTLPEEYCYYYKDGYIYSRYLFLPVDMIIIGTPFLRAFNTIFDAEENKIHFSENNELIIEENLINQTYLVIVLVIIILAYPIIIGIKKIRNKNKKIEENKNIMLEDIE